MVRSAASERSKTDDTEPQTSRDGKAMVASIDEVMIEMADQGTVELFDQARTESIVERGIGYQAENS